MLGLKLSHANKWVAGNNSGEYNEKLNNLALRKKVSRSIVRIYAPLEFIWNHVICDNISYPLFADADMEIYPRAASQYHSRPKVKRGIAMLSVDKFPYPRKQTRCNEFIPCSKDVCHILNRFRRNTVLLDRIAAAKKRTAVAIVAVTTSMTFLSRCISRWWRQAWDTCIYFTVVSQSEASVSTEHGINIYIYILTS